MNNFAQKNPDLEEEQTPHFSNQLKSFNTIHDNIDFSDTLVARNVQSSNDLSLKKSQTSNQDLEVVRS